MSYLTIEAKDVQIGDQIYVEALARNTNHCWVDVKKVRHRKHHDGTIAEVTVITLGLKRVYSPDEPTQIQRFDEESS